MNPQKCLKYCPELNQLTGSITASLLLCQLEYWFDKTQGEAFYKFLEPCGHGSYKKGDAWVEELGFSKAEFRLAFSRIGKVYKSKKAYSESKDPFDGKLYLSYYDRFKKLTYYMRNTSLVNELLRNPLSQLGYYKEIPPTKSFSYKKEDDSIPYEKVLEYFKAHCPTLAASASLTSQVKARLKALYKLLLKKGLHFLPALEQAFKQVEASDFLCGRLPHNTWIASLEWMLRPHKFFKILAGSYKPYTRSVSAHSSTTSPHRGSTFHRMTLHHFDLEALEAKERALQEARYTSNLHNLHHLSL